MSLLDLKLQNNIKTLQETASKQQQLYNILSNVRLAIFLLGAIVATKYYLDDHFQMTYSIVTVTVILFVFFIVKHGKIAGELKRTGYKITVNQQYRDRIDGKWIHFSDDGQNFVKAEHPYSSDLDIFGSKSLFQWLNVAYTFYGRNILKDYLANPEKDSMIIKKRQGAVQELAGKLDFCQEIQCAAMDVSQISNEPQWLLAYGENSQKVFDNKWSGILCYILPAVTIATTLGCIFKFPISVYIPLLLFIVQIVLTAISYIKIAPILDSAYKLKTRISAYSNVMQLIEGQPFDDKYLLQLKANLFADEQSACQQINKLQTIIELIDIRYSGILYVVLNSLFLWDYHCLFRLDHWKQANGKSIRRWLETIGYFEAVASLAVTRQINPEWCFPEFVDGSLKVSAEAIGHPLITASKRVCNQVEMENNVCLITGSNMSGKTTLLRTVGINLILAYSGGAVCAKTMECSIMNVFTSMRIADDVSSGISTFYAELIRIKMIVDYAQQQANMIFFIDEIFRGTNSRDRIMGARNVIRNLNKPWIIGLVSTHDLELCDLEHEKQANIKNYHFAESYEHHEMKFDYALRMGRSSTTNAQYLMKMIGIEWLEE